MNEQEFYYDSENKQWYTTVPEDQIPSDELEAVKETLPPESSPEPVSEGNNQPDPEPVERNIPFFEGESDEEPDSNLEDQENQRDLEAFFQPGRIVKTPSGRLYKVDSAGVPWPISDENIVNHTLENLPEPEQQPDYIQMAKNVVFQHKQHFDFKKTRLYRRIATEKNPRRLQQMLSKLVGQKIPEGEVHNVFKMLKQSDFWGE